MPDTTVHVLFNRNLSAQPLRERTRHLGLLDAESVALYINNAEEPLIVPIGPSVTLGRFSTNSGSQPEIDLTTYGAFQKGVSRLHVAIRRARDGSLMVEDLLSSNGTSLNGVRLIPYVPHVLLSGDRLRLAQLEVEIYFEATVENVVTDVHNPDRTPFSFQGGVTSPAEAETQPDLAQTRDYGEAMSAAQSSYQYQWVAHIDPGHLFSEMGIISEEIVQRFTGLTGCEVQVMFEINVHSARPFDEATIQAINRGTQALRFSRSEFRVR